MIFYCLKAFWKEFGAPNGGELGPKQGQEVYPKRKRYKGTAQRPWMGSGRVFFKPSRPLAEPQRLPKRLPKRSPSRIKTNKINNSKIYIDFDALETRFSVILEAKINYFLNRIEDESVINEKMQILQKHCKNHRILMILKVR